MPSLFVTVSYAQRPPADLALPLDVPGQLVAEAVARALQVPFTANQTPALVVLAGQERKPLSPAATLEDARLLNGSRLELELQESFASSAACLVSRTGIRFPLKQNNLVGRRDIKDSNPVDIDPSGLASERVVSRRHAAISVIGGQYVLEDLDSHNGTWVNGQRITRKILADGDVIEFGPPNRAAVVIFQMPK